MTTRVKRDAAQLWEELRNVAGWKRRWPTPRTPHGIETSFLALVFAARSKNELSRLLDSLPEDCQLPHDLRTRLGEVWDAIEADRKGEIMRVFDLLRFRLEKHHCHDMTGFYFQRLVESMPGWELPNGLHEFTDHPRAILEASDGVVSYSDVLTGDDRARHLRQRRSILSNAKYTSTSASDESYEDVKGSGFLITIGDDESHQSSASCKFVPNEHLQVAITISESMKDFTEKRMHFLIETLSPRAYIIRHSNDRRPVANWWDACIQLPLESAPIPGIREVAPVKGGNGWFYKEICATTQYFVADQGEGGRAFHCWLEQHLTEILGVDVTVTSKK